MSVSRQHASSARKLAAIMFTDIVGYTALMGSNEREAMDLVRKNREVQKPLVEKYGGTWLKEMGDGVMSSFPTASDAIYCAREIQAAMHDDKELNLRIGIHLGEIMMDAGDVYGDGVNIASRLQSIADPGGIYISDSVQKAIRGNNDIQSVLLGELKLKNVNYPVKTYAVRGEHLAQPKKTTEKHLSGRLWAELQRRNVLRAELAYLAVAFIIYYLARFLTLDNTLSYILHGLLILGIPISLYLAWNFERSPEGFVKVVSWDAWVSPYSAAQKKPFTGNAFILLLLIIIAGLLAFPKFSSTGIQQVEATMGVSVDNKKSIAVLPFDNLSNDPEQQYFSDGIQEDILNHLTKISDLNVKSRTSTLRYREDRPGIGQIGQELGVGTILEGSVRKAGNMVRINAQLIDVATDEHIWSETYDRELTEVFKIQSEVAREIARVLELKLSSDEVEDIFTIGTENITAYDYYLRARELFYYGYDPISMPGIGANNSMIELLQQAISMDPDFAEAYALLSQILYRSYKLSREIWLDSALALANKAIEVGPKIADGYVVRGLIRNNSYREKIKAGQDFEKAYALEPNNPIVLQELGTYLLLNDKPDRGAPMIVRSIELNWSKKDPEYYFGWGNVYRYTGEFDKARNLYLQAAKLAPEWNAPKNSLGFLKTLAGDYYGAIDYYTKTGSHDNMAWNYYKAGDMKKAIKHWQLMLAGEKDIEDTTGYYAVRHRLGMVHWDIGDRDKAMQYFNEQIRLNQRDIDRDQISLWGASLASSFYDLALTKAYMGDTEEALEIIGHEDIYWGSLSIMTYYFETDPMLDPIRNDPRFIAVANQWREKAEAAGKIFRQIINEREAGEQLKLGLDK
jgi:TolB-like protein/class 3 adenylate cyclase/lipoprotein NlpI